MVLVNGYVLLTAVHDIKFSPLVLQGREFMAELVVVFKLVKLIHR